VSAAFSVSDVIGCRHWQPKHEHATMMTTMPLALPPSEDEASWSTSPTLDDICLNTQQVNVQKQDKQFNNKTLHLHNDNKRQVLCLILINSSVTQAAQLNKRV